MTVVKSAREVAVEFMLSQGRHFCENSYCDCVDRLAEVIQWARSEGAALERERLAREAARGPKSSNSSDNNGDHEVSKKGVKRPLAKAARAVSVDLRKAL